MRAIFTNIYKNNIWQSDESVSWVGSDSVQTKLIKKALPKLFKEYKIKSMLDIPCWDHQRISEVKKPKYIWADIVKELIEENKTKEFIQDAVSKAADSIVDDLSNTVLNNKLDRLVEIRMKEKLGLK